MTSRKRTNHDQSIASQQDTKSRDGREAHFTTAWTYNRRRRSTMNHDEASLREMRLSKAALITTAFYSVGVTTAIIANQQGTDPEGVIWGQIILSIPWGLIPFLLGINAWYGPYVYAATIMVNAATVYMVTAAIARCVHQADGIANSVDFPSCRAMPKIFSRSLWFGVNTIGVAFVLIGKGWSFTILFAGWIMLLPGVLVCSFVETTVVGLTTKPLHFWQIADGLFIPSCVAVNGMCFWWIRRIYLRRLRSSELR